MLLYHHIGHFVLSSLCVGDLVRLVLSSHTDAMLWIRHLVFIGCIHRVSVSNGDEIRISETSKIPSPSTRSPLP